LLGRRIGLSEREERDAQLDARCSVVRARFNGRLVLFSGAPEVVRLAQQGAKFGSQISELWAKANRPFILGNCVVKETRVSVRLGDFGVHVCDLAASERIQHMRTAARHPADPGVGLSCGVVFPPIVVGHGEVERGLRITGVDRERSLEVVFCLHEIAVTVANDSEHVMHVGESIALLENLSEQRLSPVELPFLVVFAAQQQSLLCLLVRGAPLAGPVEFDLACPVATAGSIKAAPGEYDECVTRWKV